MSAPLYDNGTSLWHNQNIAILEKSDGYPSQPFAGTHEEQIKLVKDFSWLNIADLTGIDDEFNELLSSSPFIDAARRDALCIALRNRVKMLEVFI
jgi:hypothetical protein